MPIDSQLYLNSLNATTVKLGANNISKIFLGNNVVYSTTSFGSSGFQWMNINSVTSTTASGIGQNNITISITQNGGGMDAHTGMVGAATFPESYGVPLDGIQIKNTQAGVFMRGGSSNIDTFWYIGRGAYDIGPTGFVIGSNVIPDINNGITRNQVGLQINTDAQAYLPFSS